MTMNSHHGSARIYEFTPRAQLLAKSRREEAQRISELKMQSLPYVASGGAWYHDAAVQESERTESERTRGH
jgi:hypothetical protein